MHTTRKQPCLCTVHLLISDPPEIKNVTSCSHLWTSHLSFSVVTVSTPQDTFLVQQLACGLAHHTQEWCCLSVLSDPALSAPASAIITSKQHLGPSLSPASLGVCNWSPLLSCVKTESQSLDEVGSFFLKTFFHILCLKLKCFISKKVFLPEPLRCCSPGNRSSRDNFSPP